MKTPEKRARRAARDRLQVQHSFTQSMRVTVESRSGVNRVRRAQSVGAVQGEAMQCDAIRCDSDVLDNKEREVDDADAKLTATAGAGAVATDGDAAPARKRFLQE